MKEQAKTNKPFYILEKEHLGMTHADLGGYLMTLWGLPKSIIKAITFHHSPQQSHHTVFSSISAIYVANILVHEVAAENDVKETLEIDQAYINTLKLLESIAEWRRICTDMRKRVKEQDEQDKHNQDKQNME